jgi:hypothetical protein
VNGALPLRVKEGTKAVASRDDVIAAVSKEAPFQEEICSRDAEEMGNGFGFVAPDMDAPLPLAARPALFALKGLHNKIISLRSVILYNATSSL